MNGCTCDGPGYCPRHNEHKTNNAFLACKNDRNHFLQMEVATGHIVEPGLAQKASNLTHAATEYILDGLVNVSEEEQQRRMSICMECPLFNKEQQTCRLCGCYMKTKSKWRSGKCPDEPPRW